MAPRTLTVVDSLDDRQHALELLDDGQVRVGDQTYSVRAEADGSVLVEADRRVLAWTAMAGGVRWVFIDGHVYELVEPRAATGSRRRGGRDHGSQTAPMPATVRRVLVAPGDSVNAGDSLVILEAMKMELPIRATTAGVIRSVNCAEGELVQPGVTLIEIHERDEPTGRLQR